MSFAHLAGSFWIGLCRSRRKCNVHFLITLGVVTSFFMKVESYAYV